MSKEDILSVEVDIDGVVICNYWQRKGVGAAVCEAAADVLVGNDQSFGAEEGIAAGMVSVEVSIEYEAWLPAAQLTYRSHYLRGQRGELVINNEYPILSGTDGDIAARAFEHVYGARDVC